MQQMSPPSVRSSSATLAVVGALPMARHTLAVAVTVLSPAALAVAVVRLRTAVSILALAATAQTA